MRLNARRACYSIHLNNIASQRTSSTADRNIRSNFSDVSKLGFNISLFNIGGLSDEADDEY